MMGYGNKKEGNDNQQKLGGGGDRRKEARMKGTLPTDSLRLL